MTDDDIRILRTALAGGPTPGPWESLPVGHGPHYVARVNNREVVPPDACELAHEIVDARYIAACSPDRIERLLAEVERLREALTAANAQAERFEREWYLRGDEVERLRRDTTCAALTLTPQSTTPCARSPTMLDDYTRAQVNRAVEDALRPSGMSVHSGRASIDAGMLQRLIVMIDRGTEASLKAQERIAALETENERLRAEVSAVAREAQTPLTDADITALLPIWQQGAWTLRDYGRWVARAVERAHGIKTTPNLCRLCGHSIDAHDKQYGCAEDGCDCETHNNG